MSNVKIIHSESIENLCENFEILTQFCMALVDVLYFYMFYMYPPPGVSGTTWDETLCRVQTVVWATCHQQLYRLIKEQDSLHGRQGQ